MNSLSLLTVVEKLLENKYLYVLHNTENSDEIYIRIYIKNEYFANNKEININILKNIIRNIILSGIDRIIDVVVNEKTIHIIDDKIKENNENF